MTPLAQRALIAAAVVLVAGTAALHDGTPAMASASVTTACSAEDGYGDLDFWVGEWDVRADGESVGANRIEKILDGCAILEHWTDRLGGEGKSLFYRDPGSGDWKQVWVTENAQQPGGTKEKALVERLADGALRFQGTIRSPQGEYLDRTTLTPLDDGTVRQVIEISTDGGAAWREVFAAIYVREPSSASD